MRSRQPRRPKRAHGAAAELRALFAAMTDVILVLSAEGRYLSVAPSGAWLLYKPPADLLGKTVHDIFPKDQADFFVAQIRRALESRQPARVEYSLLIGGQEVCFEGSVARLDDDKVVWVARDVSERKRAERLQAATYRISQAAHTAPTLQELFKAIHGIVAELMPARNCYIALYDAASDTISFPYSVDEFDAARVPRKPRKGLTEYVLRTGRPLLVNPDGFAELERRGDVVLSGTRAVDWLGVPLHSAGTTIGVLAVQSYSEGVRYREADREVLQFVSTQVAMAVERKRAEDARRESEAQRLRTEELLRSIARGTSAVTGEDFLRSLVRHLAGALDVRYAFVGELLPGSPERVRTAALWSGDGFGSEIVYALAGTPCENVVGQVTRCYEDHVQARFPADHLLAELEAESYLGAPLFGSDGRALGNLVVMDVRPLRDEILARSVVDVFASRAGAELERLQVGTRLRESEARYRSLVEHALYGIYRSTLDGRFVAVNPALVEMLGYASEEEVLARDMARNIYADPDERQRLIARYHDAERIDGVEAVWRRKDGKPITVRLSGRPVRLADGSLEGFEMVAEDVTERRVLEEQLRQAQKMEAVGQLAGGVAHDFNNLLTAVLTSCDFVSAALPVGSPGREDLDTICRAARRGAELTQKLLAFSRRRPLKVQTLSLGALASDFSRMARRVVPEDVEVTVRVEAPETTVNADPGAIEQILMNLVTNARDAMPTGGKLVVEVGHRALDEDHRRLYGWGRPGEYVTLAVSDTGVGMDAEAQRRVFEPFFTTKPVGQGTGLGMSMVYGLVKQHEGFVKVYSEVGRGTTVRVYFPAAASQGAEERGAAAPAVRGGTETVLLVEDDEEVRRVATRVLESVGYTVLTAADGYEALDLLEQRETPPDLIVSDVVMPRVSGPHLLSRLREGGPVPKMLFTSGYTARDVQERTQLEPGLPFLAKPWTVTDLLRKVREVLDAPPATVP